MGLLNVIGTIFRAFVGAAEKKKGQIDSERNRLGTANMSDRDLYRGAMDRNQNIDARMAQAMELRERRGM